MLRKDLLFKACEPEAYVLSARQCVLHGLILGSEQNQSNQKKTLEAQEGSITNNNKENYIYVNHILLRSDAFTQGISTEIFLFRCMQNG